MDFDDLEEAEEAAAPDMSFYAISDVHAEHKQNMEWISGLPVFTKSTLLIAGDLAVSCDDIRVALLQFLNKFTHVFYCFGNHDAWVQSDDQSSIRKLAEIRDICQGLGVKTHTELIEGVWVVPIFGWYHTSWDTEPPLAPRMKLSVEPFPAEAISADFRCCKWDAFKNGSEELAQRLDEENEIWGAWPLPEDLLLDLQQPPCNRQRPIISFSHFLPRIELIPEKRFLYQPNLPKLVGSNFIRARVDQLCPNVHVFGHSHFPWNMQLDGVQYYSWPLMPPKERYGVIVCFPTADAEKWHPLKIYDTDGVLAPSNELCYQSNMYKRIKRDPCSSVMFEMTAQAFCPHAPTLPRETHCPGRRDEGPLDSVDEMNRRDRFLELSGRARFSELSGRPKS